MSSGTVLGPCGEVFLVDWGVAKLMEFLFNSTNLTDVGCTMRLIRREALTRLDHDFTVGGSAFGPEMMLLSLLLK